MKSYAMPLAIAIVGFGLMSIGFNLNGNQANATPAHFDAGPAEPTIVWYDVNRTHDNAGFWTATVIRAWSSGRIETRSKKYDGYFGDHCNVGTNVVCDTDWIVLFDANEGLNAAADINFDERVDAGDLGQLLAAWGDAPRNDLPPSDCPLGLIP